MSCLCILGVESINITSLSREHVTHALYICYMTMSCICLSLIKFMLCYVMLCYFLNNFNHSTAIMVNVFHSQTFILFQSHFRVENIHIYLLSVYPVKTNHKRLQDQHSIHSHKTILNKHGASTPYVLIYPSICILNFW